MLSTRNRPSSSTTRTPSPLPSGATTSAARPSTAASLVGLWPTTSARPSSGIAVEHAAKRSPQQHGLLLDEVGIDPAHRLEVGALARRSETPLASGPRPTSGAPGRRSRARRPGRRCAGGSPPSRWPGPHRSSRTGCTAGTAGPARSPRPPRPLPGSARPRRCPCDATARRTSCPFLYPSRQASRVPCWGRPQGRFLGSAGAFPRVLRSFGGPSRAAR